MIKALVSSIKANADELDQRLKQSNTQGELFIYDAKPSLFDDPERLDEREVLALRERLSIDIKALESLITPARQKLAHISLLPLKTSALRVALELGVADAIKAAGGSIELGELAQIVFVNENKLGESI